MTPDYLHQLADIADPDQLWRHGPFTRDLVPEKRHQCDTGVALRRHAEHIRRLNELPAGKSLLLTPLSPSGTAVMTVDTPGKHLDMQARSQYAPALVPMADDSEVAARARRYEIVRRMHPQAFVDVYKLNISTGKPFDEIIDDLGPFYLPQPTKDARK